MIQKNAEFFVDSSGWFALAISNHHDHARFEAALRERISAQMRPLTTNLVIAETHALLMRRTHRAVALAFLREVRRPPTAVIMSEPELEARAQYDWLERYADQSFSLTDAVSFAVMAERGIHEAMTNDRHFVVAGFSRVPT